MLYVSRFIPVTKADLPDKSSVTFSDRYQLVVKWLKNEKRLGSGIEVARRMMETKFGEAPITSLALTLFGIYGGLRTSKMTDWFHRNHLKATAKYTFDVGAVAKDLSCKALCSDAAKRRVELLKLISDPSVPCEAVITSLNRYLQLLMGFIVATDNKTPFSKLRGLVCVKWCDSIKPKGEPIVRSDSIFELYSVLFNVALWYTKHAAKVASNENVSEDEAKDVHLSLKTAAGLFNLLRTKYMHEFTEFVPNSDMDPNILDAYINQSLAEAQEITVARAIELKHKPYLIAGLANETAKFYEKCGFQVGARLVMQFDDLHNLEAGLFSPREGGCWWYPANGC
ncbi:unnamed protein product [Schistosoma curassoni]|uniref:BRO1 domain-containing protein n=1 Tax=Schistosoma curassoni TaxID=6186 RepID=A0A183KAW6_9TREM|nr:unnamed protein product [Schistosoma curassoni]